MSKTKKLTINRTTLKNLRTRSALKAGQSPLPSQGTPNFCVPRKVIQ